MDPDEQRRRAEAERDQALRRVDEAADVLWREEAFEFVHDYLRAHATMFVDDLWTAGLRPTREDRALGAVFQRAARAGLMVKSGSYRKSVRSHMTEKPVWRSLCVDRLL